MAKIKVKLAAGQVAFTASGARYMADAEGIVEVEQFTQDHYDLVAQGGQVQDAETVEDEGAAE